MGFIDKVKSAVGSGSDSSGGGSVGDELAAEIEEEEDGWDEDEVEDEWEEDEEEEQEWDTAYRFAEDILEPDGHASMKDFGKKFMFYKCARSPMYRDRIKNGSETMQMIAKSTERFEEAMGGGDSADYGDMADKLRDANRLIDEADKVSGKEDQIVQDALGLGHELVNAIGQNAGGSPGEVNSSMKRSDREI